jgi:all-trans-retinol dehydrogenase (NAD+)
MKDLKGKVVLVTGAGRGMGELHARNFAKEGARVVLTDVDEEAVKAAAQYIRDQGGEAHAYLADISDRSSCFALEKSVASEIGPVDVLINNAGIVECEGLLAMSESAIRRITDVNYLGQVWMMQAFLPSMIERKSGHVVNICSVAGKVGTAMLGAYCATKFAMIGVTDAVRHELRKSKVKFTIVNPGYIATGMFQGAKVPLITRWQDPQKVADALIDGVKKGHAEICVPRFVVRATAFARGLCPPKLTDPIFFLLRAHKSFATWKKDTERPF